MAYKCFSNLAQSRPPSVSPKALDNCLHGHTIVAYKFNAKCLRSWLLSVSLSSPDHGLHGYLQIWLITSSMCICKLAGGWPVSVSPNLLNNCLDDCMIRDPKHIFKQAQSRRQRVSLHSLNCHCQVHLELLPSTGCMQFRYTVCRWVAIQIDRWELKLNTWVIKIVEQQSCSYGFRSHQQCSQWCHFSQTSIHWVMVLAGLSLALPGAPKVVVDMLTLVIGNPMCSQTSHQHLEAWRQQSQVLSGAPNDLSSVPRCSQTYQNHSQGTMVPVICDPSNSEGGQDCPPSVRYSSNIDTSQFILHILSDIPEGSKWLKYILLISCSKVMVVKERDERQWGNHHHKLELVRTSCASQFSISNTVGTTLNLLGNITNPRSSKLYQVSHTTDFSYPLVSSISFSSSSSISFSIPQLYHHRTTPS